MQGRQWKGGVGAAARSRLSSLAERWAISWGWGRSGRCRRCWGGGGGSLSLQRGAAGLSSVTHYVPVAHQPYHHFAAAPVRMDGLPSMHACMLTI